MAGDESGLLWLRLRIPGVGQPARSRLCPRTFRFTLLSLSDGAAIATVFFSKLLPRGKIAVTDSCVRHYSCVVTNQYLAKVESLGEQPVQRDKRKGRVTNHLSFFCCEVSSGEKSQRLRSFTQSNKHYLVLGCATKLLFLPLVPGYRLPPSYQMNSLATHSSDNLCPVLTYLNKVQTLHLLTSASSFSC